MTRAFLYGVWGCNCNSRGISEISYNVIFVKTRERGMRYMVPVAGNLAAQVLVEEGM